MQPSSLLLGPLFLAFELLYELTKLNDLYLFGCSPFLMKQPTIDFVGHHY